MDKSWAGLTFWESKSFKDILKRYEDRAVEWCPPRHQWFTALDLPLENVKAVILGQDPYHSPGMAHGLAFSVLPHVRQLPPTLKNILAEYSSDLGLSPPRNGCLRGWHQSGVLLLNTGFSVERGKPNSHKGWWSKLTTEIILKVCEQDKTIVFNLWGKEAQTYTPLVLDHGQVVYELPHPSPLAQGFKGGKPFSMTNTILEKFNEEPVNWKLK